MKCLFAIVFVSIVLVECIHATPFRKQAAQSDWEPVFQDDPYVPMENNDEGYEIFEKRCTYGRCSSDDECCDNMRCLWKPGANEEQGYCK
ncbi:hypothetical protein ACROYT_G026635 [Oculina patagonica]